MEAVTNYGGKEVPFEDDCVDHVSLLLGNQNAYETTPFFPSNENGGIMSDNPSQVANDQNLLQLDLTPQSLDTPVPVPAVGFELPLLPNPAKEAEMGIENGPQLAPLPPIIQFNDQPQNGFQPELFLPQPVAPVVPNHTFGGDGHGQFMPRFPQPQPQMWTGDGVAPPWMNQQKPTNYEQWLSVNNNTPGPLYMGWPAQMMPQGGREIMLPDPSLSLRPPLPATPQYPPLAATPQYHSALPNSMLPWYQQAFNPNHQPYHKQMSMGEFLATPFDPRELGQNAPFHPFHLFNVPGHMYQDMRGNENYKIPVPLQLDTVPIRSKRKGKETQQPRKKLERGESSSSQKRKKVAKTSQKTESNQDTQKNDGNPIAVDLSLRPANTNAVYNPVFETVGLPVDPHLRMFP